MKDWAKLQLAARRAYGLLLKKSTENILHSEFFGQPASNTELSSREGGCR